MRGLLNFLEKTSQNSHGSVQLDRSNCSFTYKYFTLNNVSWSWSISSRTLVIDEPPRVGVAGQLQRLGLLHCGSAWLRAICERAPPPPQIPNLTPTSPPSRLAVTIGMNHHHSHRLSNVQCRVFSALLDPPYKMPRRYDMVRQQNEPHQPDPQDAAQRHGEDR